MVNPSVKGISRKSKRNGGKPGVYQDGARGEKNLGEQSTDEGKSNNITHLDSETHSATSVALARICLGGE